jgi:hypothetical protein
MDLLALPGRALAGVVARLAGPELQSLRLACNGTRCVVDDVLEGVGGGGGAGGLLCLGALWVALGDGPCVRPTSPNPMTLSPSGLAGALLPLLGPATRLVPKWRWRRNAAPSPGFVPPMDQPTDEELAAGEAAVRAEWAQQLGYEPTDEQLDRMVAESSGQPSGRPACAPSDDKTGVCFHAWGGSSKLQVVHNFFEKVFEEAGGAFHVSDGARRSALVLFLHRVSHGPLPMTYVGPPLQVRGGGRWTGWFPACA